MNRVDRSTAHRPEPTGLRWIATAVLRTWAGSLAEAWTNRRGFWVQVWAMVANDAVWVLFWLFFFRRFESIRGWEFQDIVVLQAVLTTAGGFVLGLLANSRLIGQAIADGELDAALGLPIPTLPYLLVRRIDVTFIGDIIFGVSLFFILADPTPIRLAIFVTTAVASAAMIVGFLVLIGSTAFFLGRSEVGDLGFQALLLFAVGAGHGRRGHRSDDRGGRCLQPRSAPIHERLGVDRCLTRRSASRINSTWLTATTSSTDTSCSSGASTSAGTTRCRWQPCGRSCPIAASTT